MSRSTTSTAAATTATMLLLLLAATTACAQVVSSSFDCSRAEVDGARYDLRELGGPRAVVTSQFLGAAYTNTSYTVDICAPLERSGGAPKGDECPTGTRACAIRRLISLDGKVDSLEEVIAIAGDLDTEGGGPLSPTLTRLSADPSSHRPDGLRVMLQGGAHFLHDPIDKKRRQRVVIDFLCDEEKTGKEGFWSPEDHFKGEPGGAGVKSRSRRDERADEDHEEHQLRYENSALIWEGYGLPADGEPRTDELRLAWHTKAVCPSNAGVPGGDGEGGGSGGWGFFKWIVVILFLAIAAYLIFGSWLNYSRYGARGWDLLPHGDAIRDVPYLMADWARKVLNTVQGAGSRGGYTAV